MNARAWRVALLVLVVAPRLHAQAPEAGDPRYRDLVRMGVEEYGAGRYEEAESLFEQAYAVRPSARALRGIAKALFELRRYSQALAAIDRALAGEVDPLTGVLRDELEALRARTLHYVASIDLRVDPQEAEVLVDGRPVKGGPVTVDAGTHTLEARAPGRLTEHRAFDATGGGVVTLEIALRPEPPSVAPAPPAEAARPSRTPVYVSAGVLTAAVGATIASIVWFADRDHAARSCSDAASGVGCANASSIAFERNASIWVVAGASTAAVAATVAFVLAVRSASKPSSVACRAAAGFACTGTIAW